MSLTKSKGNMYEWCSHTHSHLRGGCPHACIYCYCKAMDKRYGTSHFSGPLRLVEKEFDVKYGSNKTIFMEHLNDLWAKGVPDEWILKVLSHCRMYPENEYVFQSKNPARFIQFLTLMPSHTTLITTIETNRKTAGLSRAPSVSDRAKAMAIIYERIKTL